MLSIYTDKTGHLTIGYGYNLSVYSYESKRITKPQAYRLLTDILKKIIKLSSLMGGIKIWTQ
ncbi:glycoside hydrolase family protein [Helicobacter pylori]|uniref:glycoside hydrolase family protein n=1 Tax=Helicobacter pylori TaxID=210 RepID=UPI003C75DC3B